MNYAEVAGQSNIEWDAVDIVGNVFLHWYVLKYLNSHISKSEKVKFCERVFFLVEIYVSIISGEKI